MERKGFIGGSDCVKIMNGNWYDLWAVKTGRVESDDLDRNLAVQMGILTEDFNIEWFEIEYDKHVDDQQKTFKKTAWFGEAALSLRQSIPMHTTTSAT